MTLLINLFKKSSCVVCVNRPQSVEKITQKEAFEHRLPNRF